MTGVKLTVPFTSGQSRAIVRRFGRTPRVPAVPLLPPDCTEGQWRAARLARVGASELAAVLECSPYASPFSLWWSKQEGWPTPETLGMKVGTMLEPIIAELFAQSRPDLMVARSGAGLWGHPDYDFLSCTPDFLAVTNICPDCMGTINEDENCPLCNGVGYMRTPRVEPVECKSDEGGAGWGRPGTDEVPAHHAVQVFTQCEIFDADRGHLVRLAGKRFAAYVLDYTPDRRATMRDAWIPAARSFVTSLETGIQPDIDGHKATAEALRERHPAIEPDKRVSLGLELVRRLDRYSEAVKHANAELALVKNQIRDALGDAEFGTTPGGTPVIHRTIGKRAGYSVAPTIVDSVRRMKGDLP